jgi:UDP-glucose:(heptosyl)LPS alpha-1,3-glucosyltransferase
VSADRPLALVRRGYSPTGGAEKFLARFASAARAAGREVMLVNDRPWPPEASAGLPQNTLPVRGPRAFAAAVDRWRAGREDAVVFSLERLLSADCYRAGDGVLASWVRRRAVYDPGWVTRLRALLPKQRDMLALERHCFSAGDTGEVIVNSRMVAREIAAFFGYPAERVHLVRNGLPDDFAVGVPDRGAARKMLGLAEDAFIAAFAGTGWKRKGLRFATAALARCGVPRASLVVAGRGPERAHRGPHVVFLGPQRDVRPLLAAADVFILPTVYDPFSNACLEALAMGRPVITTAANGCAEILREGVTGSVAGEPHDVAVLAAALRYWAEDGRAAAAAGDCRATAAECSLADNVRRTLEILGRARTC